MGCRPHWIRTSTFLRLVRHTVLHRCTCRIHTRTRQSRSRFDHYIRPSALRCRMCLASVGHMCRGLGRYRRLSRSLREGRRGRRRESERCSTVERTRLWMMGCDVFVASRILIISSCSHNECPFATVNIIPQKRLLWACEGCPWLVCESWSMRRFVADDGGAGWWMFQGFKSVRFAV